MAEYVNAPIPVDPDELEQEAYEIIVSAFPDWEPSEGNLDVWLIKAFAHIGAQVGETTTDVTETIFRHFGAELANLPPLEASAATGLTTWTLIDTDGHTIPAGTVVGFDDGESLVAFQTVEDTEIAAAADTATGVEIVAVETGIAANDLTGTGQLIDPLDYVDSVVLDFATSGGEDEETDEDYRDRLVAELRLLSPRPILPADFAVLAKRISGVERATAINGYDPVDESSDNERMITVVAVDEDGEAVSAPIKAQIDAYLTALREVNFIVNTADPTYTTVDVTFTAVAWAGWDAEEVETAAETAVANFLSPATWGQGPDGNTNEWNNEPVVRYLEVAAVLNGVQGLNYVSALTIDGGTADIEMTGVAPLPRAGTIDGTVT